MRLTTNSGSTFTLLSLLGASVLAQSEITDNGACFNGGGWSFRLRDDSVYITCSYDTVIDEFKDQIFDAESSSILKNTCTHSAEEEFWLLLGVDTIDEARDAVYDLCATAHENIKELTLSDALPQMKEGQEQFIENFFNGRGPWNEETETELYPGDENYPVNELWRDANFVKNLYTDSQNAVFNDMPDLPQFHPDVCQAHAAMCCFLRDRQANDSNGNCANPYDTTCINKDVGDNKPNPCYVELTHAPYSNGIDASGFSLFPDEGPIIHCNG